MESKEEVLKAKSLAVFENVITKGKQQSKCKKFRTNRFSDDDSSQSENDLVIVDEMKDEETKKRKHCVRVTFKQEPLNISCLWDNCLETFTNFELFYNHLAWHVEQIADDFECKWINCPNPVDLGSYDKLLKHIMYHGYYARLVNIGENIIQRNNLPECRVKSFYSIDVDTKSYLCEWEECGHNSNTILDYFFHVECHAKAAPSGKKKGENVVIECQWKLCKQRFSTRYRLSDHLKVHTKEKMVACPECYTLFSTKLTFSDHRNRQLKSDLRSYQCSQCLKLFSSERILSEHMKAHINQYKCNMCDMTCPKPSMLAKHYRYKHMDIRSFACSFCDKKFVAKCNLNTHLLTHQEKPFKCDQCEFGCKSKIGLTNHMIKIHGKETTYYECQICKTPFLRGCYLTKHLMNFHKFQWPSGHSRFRYRKDSDGVFRLQTVRYESLEVTEEMIKSESMKPVEKRKITTYNLVRDETDGSYKLTLMEEEEQTVKQIENLDIAEDRTVENREIIVTIEDVDENGVIIKSEEIEVGEIIIS
ncbi:histone H4 transcription factor-like [Sitophilus oryzae]|uniref:Histone H4 transcription factor-like n=1 Tax=Sitophilus oryzae TaxID=7048 RepID=A0A6J2X5G4_SITOR|nr:histone H4 transcription factor-like [Sitophilus oryzae]